MMPPTKRHVAACGLSRSDVVVISAVGARSFAFDWHTPGRDSHGRTGVQDDGAIDVSPRNVGLILPRPQTLIILPRPQSPIATGIRFPCAVFGFFRPSQSAG